MNMKVKIMMPVLISIATALTVGSCNQTSETKMEQAQEEVKQAQTDLHTAENKYSEEWATFKADIEIRINENDRKIEELENKASNKHGKAKDEFKRRISLLKEKNHAMRERLGEYRNDGHEKWDDFKNDFNHSMNEIGDSFEELFSDKN